MSLDNHPNFHAVKFVTDLLCLRQKSNDNEDSIRTSLMSSLRGKAENCPKALSAGMEVLKPVYERRDDFEDQDCFLAKMMELEETIDQIVEE